MSEARRITHALQGHWYGRYGLACCPAHDDKTPSLSLRDAGGKLLARCHTGGCTFHDIIDALKYRGVVDGVSTFVPPSDEDLEKLRQQEEEEARKQEQRALECWNASLPIGGSIAEQYLRGRAITCDLPDTLRFHPDCRHPSTRRLPAMVAAVEGAARFAVHRTFLKPDGSGKADIEPAKAMLGAVAGGAVRLTGSGYRIVACEGIETGLSLASGLFNGNPSIWAALSTSGLKRLVLPDHPGWLIVATDGDDPGRAAGKVLAERADALGWQVSLLPAPDGRDWNDVFKEMRNERG